MTVATRNRRAKLRKAPPPRVVNMAAAKAPAAKPPTDDRGSSGSIGWGGVMSSLAADYAASWQLPKRWTTVENMRADPAVTAALAALTFPILGAALTVEGASDDPEDVKLAEFIEEGLANMTTDLATHRMESLDSVGDGTAVFYTRYEKREDDLWWLRKLKLLPNKSIVEWNIDEDHGDPVGVTQTLPSGQPEVFTMDELLVFTHMRRGDSLLGRPALRAMYRPWFLIDKLSRIGAIAVERGASGTPWARYTGGSDTEARKLDRALQGLHAQERAYLRIDEDVTDWGIKGIEGATVDAVPLMEYQRRDLFLAPLAQFLALGSDGVGSMALSGDHSSFFLMALEFVATELEETYNRYLIPRWIGYNWTVPADRLPRVKIGPINRRNAEAWFASLNAAVNAGVELQRDELDKVANELLGVTLKPKEEEPEADTSAEIEPTLLNGIQIQSALDIIGRFSRAELTYIQAETALKGFLAINAQIIPRLLGRDTGDGGDAPTPAPAAPGADVADVNDPNVPEATTDADAPGDKPTPLAAGRAWPGVTLAAAPLKSPIMLEALGVPVDFAGMTSALDEAEARIIRDLAPLQEKQRNRLLIAARKIVRDKDAEAIDTFDVQSDKEEAAILAALVALYAAGGDNALKELEGQGVKPSKVESAVKAAGLAYLGVVAAEAARSLADRLRTAWGSAVVGQIQTGYNADALAAAITAPGDRLLADVARRGSSTALGMGRTDAVAANGKDVRLEIWSAAMDSSTCASCAALDGEEFEVGKGPAVPNPDCAGGAKCRCIRIPIAFSEKP